MTSNKTQNIAVIGAGTMGRGIAQVFAQAGYPVRLYDTFAKALESAKGEIEKHLGRAVEKGRLAKGEADAALDRLHIARDWSDLGTNQLIVEAVTEKLEVKRDVLNNAQQALADDGILASNTSSISITQLAAGTEHPDRFIGMHFFNPVPVMKLVEVVRGLQTSDETTKRIVELAEAVGKVPVQCNDHPGFVSNRVLMPMINEAIFALQDHVAEVKAIDDIMTLGMAHPMGPLALADLIGLDVCLNILEVLHRDLGEDRYRPCPLLRKYVAAGRLGRKTKQGFHKYD